MLGWLDIARDRVLVALTIGAALAAAGRLPLRGAGARALLLGAAMAGGALAGEAVLAAFALSNAAPDTGALVGRALRWIVVAGCVAAMFYLWRRGAEAQAAAQRAELRAAELDRQQLQTRLLALRSQIEPHFLFNTLATVRRLHHTDPVQGAALLGHFLAYLRTPHVRTPSHPEYPAAHGCHDGAIAEILRSFFGTKQVRFSFDSTASGTTHYYDTTDDLVRDVRNGRVWGGMHFRNSVVVGTEVGKDVAKWVAKKHFQAVE